MWGRATRALMLSIFLLQSTVCKHVHIYAHKLLRFTWRMCQWPCRALAVHVKVSWYELHSRHCRWWSLWWCTEWWLADWLSAPPDVQCGPASRSEQHSASSPVRSDPQKSHSVSAIKEIKTDLVWCICETLGWLLCWRQKKKNNFIHRFHLAAVNSRHRSACLSYYVLCVR